MRLQGKTALVTGAGRGIGLAISRRFQAEGANVIGLDQQYPESVSSAIFSKALCCDVSSRADVEGVINQVAAEYDSIDLLVNNAGINPDPTTVDQTAAESLDAIIETNLKSLFHVTSVVLPLMKQGGVILNIASMLGLRGVPSCAAYTASKGGILSVTRAMARDYAPEIRVNAISPGAIETAMFDEYLERVDCPDHERERIRTSIPLQRLGLAEDIATAALFLASDDASWITGQNLVVDGGDSI